MDVFLYIFDMAPEREIHAHRQCLSRWTLAVSATNCKIKMENEF